MYYEFTPSQRHVFTFRAHSICGGLKVNKYNIAILLRVYNIDGTNNLIVDLPKFLLYRKFSWAAQLCVAGCITNL